MKKKYLKKMLAIMLASMTVAATPGLVGAMKEESRNAINEINLKFARNRHKVHLTKEDEIDEINMLNHLEEIANEDDEAKDKVAKNLKDGFVEYLVREKFYDKIINILQICSQSKNSKTKCDIAESVEYIAYAFGTELNQAELFDKIINLLQICSTEPVAMRKVANSIYHINKGQRHQFNNDSCAKMLDILEECAKKSTISRVYVADAIGAMFNSKVETMVGFMNHSLDRAINILEICAQDPNDRDKVTLAVGCITDRHLVGHNLIDKVHRILGILNAFSNYSKLFKHDAIKTIFHLVCHGVLTAESMDETLINAIKKFSEDNLSPTIAHMSLLLIKVMIDKGLLNQCGSDKTQQIVDILLSFSGKSNAIRFTSASRCVVCHDVLSRCRDDQVQKMFTKLIEILKMNNSKAGRAILVKNAAEVVAEMVGRNLLTEENIDDIYSFARKLICVYDIDNVIPIIKAVLDNDNILRRSSDRISETFDLLANMLEKDFGSVYEVVKTMVDRNLLKNCSYKTTQKIVALLSSVLSCSSDHIKKDAVKIILAINAKGLLNRCDSGHIQNLAYALIGYLKIGSHEENACIGVVISEMYARGVLKKCEPADLAGVVSSLINNLDNNNAREISVKIIAAIIQNHNVLKQLNDAQIQKLINSLPGALGNNNTQEAATTILAAMAENDMLNKFNNAQIQQILGLLKEQLRNYLTAGNHEMVDKIFKVLASCSRDDNLREYTSDIIGMLSGNVNFYRYLNQNAQIPRLENVLETLILCTQAKNERTREAALDVIDSVFINTTIPEFKKIVVSDSDNSKSEKILINNPDKSESADKSEPSDKSESKVIVSKFPKTIKLTDQTIAQINNKIPQIIEMLKRLSTVRGSKKAVASIMDSLGKRGFFRELPKEGQDGLIATLRNFLTYNGRQIASSDFNLSYFEMEDLNHADALPAVCNLVKNNTWTAPLFADNLLSENKKEFKKVSADISKVGQKLCATETNE